MIHLKKLSLWSAIIICHSIVIFTSEPPSNNHQSRRGQVDGSYQQTCNNHLKQQNLLQFEEVVQQEKQNIAESEASIAIVLKKIHNAPSYEQPITNNSTKKVKKV